MALLLILPLLVSGYLACLTNQITYSKLHRYEGQLLYLLVAYKGLVSLSMALAAVGLVSLAASHQWGNYCLAAWPTVCKPFSTDFLALGGSWIGSAVPTAKANGQLYAFLIVVGIVTLLVPFPMSRLEYWQYKRNKGFASDEIAQAFLLRESVADIPICAQLAESMLLQTPLLISMDDRKVYVGIVSSIGKPSEAVGADQDFGLWPSISGYRHKDELTITYTSEYPEFDVTNSIPIYFRQANIVSLTPYSSELEEQIVARGRQSPPSKSSLRLAGIGLAAGLIAGGFIRLFSR